MTKLNAKAHLAQLIDALQDGDNDAIDQLVGAATIRFSEEYSLDPSAPLFPQLAAQGLHTTTLPSSPSEETATAGPASQSAQADTAVATTPCEVNA